MTGHGPASIGNDPKELVYLDNGQRISGVTLSFGGKEQKRTTAIEMNEYLMENYNPMNIPSAVPGESGHGDGKLFAGGVRTSAPNSQDQNKLELEVDGLNKFFKEYSVIVYLDAPASISSLIQNPSDSTLGQIYGIGESIRKVSVDSVNKSDSFYLDDAAHANDPTYNTFNGNYIQATAKNALNALGQYANYVVFDGLTDDRFVVTITDGVLQSLYYRCHRNAGMEKSRQTIA